MRGLGEKLVERGFLSAARLAEAQETADRAFKPLAAVLTDLNMVDEERLMPVLAEQYGLDFVCLRDMKIGEEAIKALSPKLVSHYRVMPVKMEKGVLTVAVSDPLDMTASEDIETSRGLRVQRVVACRSDILEALRSYYGVGAETVERILSETDRDSSVRPADETHDLEKKAEDASVVKLVNQILHEAISDNATDIHFEARRDAVVLRRRIDGVLYDTKIPRHMNLLYPAIVSRVKLMSGLNIVERRLPQDGRAGVNIGRERYDLRVSVIPAMHGEDVVVRILPAAMVFRLEDLGFSERNGAILEEMLGYPHGIIMVTGPTGSGKSTTLYACLNRLNTRERKIITIEEPVEYELDGITQTQVNPGIGLTFAKALRAMLRHDPDVMMVGEVRDGETAEIAMQTAMTGHLVLSTLHTNDAAGGAVRLIDMGIEPYLIASTVRLFVAQRLVRTLCVDCREAVRDGGKTLFRPAGCRKCHGSGYRGRIAISEFLRVDREIQDLITAGSSAAEIRDRAVELGMISLAADGNEKVAAGLTTADEVLRVTTA